MAFGFVVWLIGVVGFQWPPPVGPNPIFLFTLVGALLGWVIVKVFRIK